MLQGLDYLTLAKQKGIIVGTATRQILDGMANEQSEVSDADALRMAADLSMGPPESVSLLIIKIQNL